MGLANPVRGLYGARSLICAPLPLCGKVRWQWPDSMGPDADLSVPVGQSELAVFGSEGCRGVCVLPGGYRSQLTIWCLRGLCVVCMAPGRGFVSLQCPGSTGPDVDLTSLLHGPFEACAWSVRCPGVDLSALAS